MMTTALGIVFAVFMGDGLALSWDDIRWDEICGAEVAIMPEQSLYREIALCASGGSANCIYLAEMFDITNPEWYIVDAIPSGWRMDATNREWRRKPANDIRVRKAWRYVPEIVGAFITFMDRSERHEVDAFPAEMPSPFELVYKVTGHTFHNSWELKKWVETAWNNLADVLTKGRDNARKASAKLQRQHADFSD
jgi:hypothetical protein